jgi:hypothetical protein
MVNIVKGFYSIISKAFLNFLNEWNVKERGKLENAIYRKEN